MQPIKIRIAAIEWNQSSGTRLVVLENTAPFQTIRLPRNGPLANAQAGDIVAFADSGWTLEPMDGPSGEMVGAGEGS